MDQGMGWCSTRIGDRDGPGHGVVLHQDMKKQAEEELERGRDTRSGSEAGQLQQTSCQ